MFFYDCHLYAQSSLTAPMVQPQVARAPQYPPTMPNTFIFCENESLVFSAYRLNYPTQPIFNWYNDFNGSPATKIGMGQSVMLLFDPKMVGLGANFYVSYTAIDPISGLMIESPKTKITVLVKKIPFPPTAINDIYCQNSPAHQIVAYTSDQMAKLLWYNSSVGGTSSPITPMPTTTSLGIQTYWVTQSYTLIGILSPLNNTCESPRTPVTVTVNPIPSMPIVANVTANQGSVPIPLTALGSGLLWYTSATGGSGSSLAPIPSTSTVGTTSYYVSQTVGTCESARAKIDVTINKVTSAGIIGNNQNVCAGQLPGLITEVKAASDSISTLYQWEYSDDSIVWHSIPAATLTSYQPDTIYADRWFRRLETDTNGLHLVNTGFELPLIPTTMGFMSFNSTFIQGWQTTEADSLIKIWSNVPNGLTNPTGNQFCELNANTASRLYQKINLTNGETLNWSFQHRGMLGVDVAELNIYSANGATKMAVLQTASTDNSAWKSYTGSTVITLPTGTYQFSFEAISTSSGNMSEGNFLDDIHIASQVSNTVKMTVNKTIQPIDSTFTFCSGTKATQLTASGQNLLWYTTATGGIGSSTAPTPATNGSSTYYVTQTISGCESPRAKITVLIKVAPGTKVTVNSPVTYCLNDKATALQATGCLGNLWCILLWSTDSTGDISTFTSSAPVPSTTKADTTTYYVVSGLIGNDCIGDRVPVVVIVNPLPTITAFVSTSATCLGQSNKLVGYGAASYNWDGGVFDNTLFTPTATKTYSVTGTDANGCKNTSSANVYVNQPTSSTINATIYQGSSYSLIGKTYNITGTYTDTIFNNVGCDSIITLNLTVLSPGSNQHICKGNTANLQTSLGGIFQGWTPSATVANPSSIATTALPSVTTVYTATSFIKTSNLVSNGDFEGTSTATMSGNTKYLPWPGGVDLQEGYFAIATSPQNVHGLYAPFSDHTSGIGNMMVINGGNDTTLFLWKQSVTVTPNTNYDFSAWITTAHPGNPPIVQFKINGTLIGTPVTVGSTVGLWQPFNATWNSGTSTSADIKIYDRNSSTGGNDFALDDIAFSTLTTITDTVTVIVDNLPDPNIKDTSTCQGNSIVLNAGTGMDSYLWSTGATSQTITTGNSGNYIVTVTKNNCSATDTIAVTITPLPSVNLGADVTICYGTSTILDAGTGMDAYLWNDGSTNETNTISNAGYFIVTVTQGLCSNQDTINIGVNQVGAPSVTTPVLYFKNAPASSLSAAVNSKNSLLWYTAASGGLGTSTAPTPSTAIIDTTKYYVSQELNGCEGPRSEIDVIIAEKSVHGIIGYNSIVCEGQLPALIDQIQPASNAYNGGMYYQWQYSDDSLTWNAIPWATDTTYQPDSIHADRWFRRLETDSNGIYLVNTSFEAPETPTIVGSNWQLFDASLVSGWHTTATDNLIEIWGNNFMGVTAAKGNQHAELNATMLSRLYQNVNLINGEILNWSFQHRGRSSLGPDMAELNIYSADGLTKLVTLQKVSTDNTAWKTYSGSNAITLPNGIYQFSFEALSSGSGNMAEGNFLDDIHIVISQITNVVKATYKATVSPSIVNRNYCNASNAGSLTATGKDLLWYTSAIGGTGSTTAPIPSTGIDSTYYVSQTVDGCESKRAKIAVTIIPLPSVTATSQSLCKGTATQLNGQGANSYYWDGGITNNVTFTPTVTRTYSVTGTDSNGCSNTSSVTVTVNQPSSSTTSASICQGTNYPFNGKTYTTAGTYSDTLVNAAGCDSTATLVLSIKSPSKSTTTASFCQGAGYSFNGKTYTTSGTYSDTLVNAVGCDSTATLVLSIKSPSKSTTIASICQGAGYSFNGKTYTTAGTYSDTLVNAAGCDSTATLVLSIKSPSKSTTTASICQGAGYSFNGKTYTTAGTYSDTLVNAAGCDSTATLVLSIKSSSSSTTSASICQGTNFSFNGKTYTTSGTYSDTLVNAVGCDSTATLVLSIKSPSNSTTIASICQGAGYSFNGKTYTTAGTYSDTLVNAVGCDSTATLVLSIKNPSKSTTIASICQGTNYSFNGKTYTSAGTYSDTLVNAVGCDSTATLVLSIKSPSSSTTSASICQGTNYSFNGKTYTTAGTYSDTLVNAVGCDSTATLMLSIKNPSKSTTIASICQGADYSFNGKTYTTAGTYSAKLVNADGCDSTATLMLSIKNPSSSTTVASICQGAGYSFNGNTYTTAGTYFASLVNASGCDSIATLVLDIKNPTSSTITASLCQGDSYSFNENNYSSTEIYFYHTSNAVGCDSTVVLNLTVVNPSFSTIYATICNNEHYSFNGKNYIKGGTYTSHKNNALGCDSAITLYLTVKEKPEVTIKGDSLICENTLREPYTIETKDTSDNFTWKITGNNRMYAPKSDEIKTYHQIDWLVSEIDTISVIDNNGFCKTETSLIVKIAPHSKPKFIWEEMGGNTMKVRFTNKTDQPVINEGSTTETIPFNYFIWNFFTDNSPIETQSASSYSHDSVITERFSYGYHPILLKSINNYCIDSIIQTIFVAMEEGLFIPNSFVPGSPSTELSVFKPKGYNLKTYKITIYDSWGNLIWYSDKLFNGSPAEGWTGISNGDILKLDTYVWKVEATFLDGSRWEGQQSSIGEKKKNFGNVLLLR
jgi:hypothetical protein